MSSSSLTFNDAAQTAQTTPTVHGCPSPETWVESVSGFQMYHIYRARCEQQNRQAPFAVAQRSAEALDHIDPRLLQPTGDLTQESRAERQANRSRRASNHIRQGVSPRAQREVERLDAYICLRESKEQIRRIIRLIQDKRRDEFRVLRDALYQVYHYAGPYLQRPGEKEAAAQLICVGSLGKEFVQQFDSQAKWQWLQLRVNSLKF
ncbi:hypothetical protein DFH28DRAFT_1118304 [Melampsora americana]|nr:hypothetical protein DFH28DRAFT_1118304 [Melampsora americana]